MNNSDTPTHVYQLNRTGIPAKSAARHRCRRLFQPAVERLEPRQLLAADITCALGSAAPMVADSVEPSAQLQLVSDGSAEGEAGMTARQPVLILPGILGSLPRHDLAEWLTFDEGAMAPENLQLDPVKLTYNDLIASLVSAGYNDGTLQGPQTLWAAPYDWRLPVAPRDGISDGLIDSTHVDPTDTVWEYGIEYLHYWIDQARQAWIDGGSDPAEFQVDIIAHSMGGLLARSYLQSDLYSVGTIDQLLMLGTPNHGAVDAYQVREWINDTLTLAPDVSLQRIEDGLARAGSDTQLAGSLLAAGVVLLNSPDVESYSPSLTDLLPTFEFISRVWPHLGLQGIDDNVLLADLNTSFDYASQGVEAHILLGTGTETDYELYHPLGLSLLNVVAFDNLPAGDGDGRVLASSALLDAVMPHELMGVEHLELAGADVAAQQAIFALLGVDAPDGGYSTGAFRSVLAGLASWLPHVNTHPWHNAVTAADVNGDGYVSPADALHVIATLNHDGSRFLPLDRVRSIVAPYFDVNQDGAVSPADALWVIYRLNHGNGEGEGTTHAVSSTMVLPPVAHLLSSDSLAASATDELNTSAHHDRQFDLAAPIERVREALPTGWEQTDQILARTSDFLHALSADLEDLLAGIADDVAGWLA